MNDTTSALQVWVDRLRAGNPLAREELLRRSQERFRQLTRRMFTGFRHVHAWENTSAVFNAALLRLDRALKDAKVLHEIRTTQDLLKLSATQIRRELIDLARKYKNRPRQAAGDFPEVAAPDVGPDRIAMWAEFHRRIEEELSDEEQRIFDYLVYHDLSQPEAAELIGVGLTTLKKRWQALRLKLSRMLGDDLAQ